jgi:hypothetical protein
MEHITIGKAITAEVLKKFPTIYWNPGSLACTQEPFNSPKYDQESTPSQPVPSAVQFISLHLRLCLPSTYFFFTWRMVSSEMLHRVVLVRTDVSEKLSASFIRLTRIGELGTTLAVTSNRCTLRRNIDSCHPDEGGAKILRNVGSYKSHTA